MKSVNPLKKHAWRKKVVLIYTKIVYQIHILDNLLFIKIVNINNVVQQINILFMFMENANRKKSPLFLLF